MKTLHRLRRPEHLPLLLLLLVVFLANSATLTAQGDVARLRVGHFLEGSDPELLDFFLDGEPLAEKYALGEVSEAVRLPPGEHTVTVGPAGGGAPILSQNVRVSADSTYDFFVARSPEDKVEGFLLSALLGPPYPGWKPSFRLLHASAELGRVYFVFYEAWDTIGFGRDDRWYAGWNYVNFLTGGRNQFELFHLPARQNDPTSFTHQFWNYEVVTVVLTGSLDAGDVRVWVIDDRDTNEQRPAISMRRTGEDDGALRRINMVPDILGHEGRITIAPFLSSGFRGRVPGIHHDYKGRTRIAIITRIGNDDVQVLHDTITVNTDTLYSIYALGSARDTTVRGLVLTNWLDARPPVGEAWVRVLHAQPGIGPIDMEIFYEDNTSHPLQNIPFAEATDYFSAPPGAISLKLYRRGEETPYLETRGALPGDSLYTLIASGIETRNNLGVNLINDLRDPVGFEPMTLFEGSSSVPVAGEHLSSLQVYPNPLKGRGVIEGEVKQSGPLQLELYDTRGRFLRLLSEEQRYEGRLRIGFDVSDLASGFYQLILRDSDGGVVGTQGIRLLGRE